MTIPTGVIYALVPVLATGAVTFAAWLVRELSHLAEINAATTERLTAVGKRVERLEGWQDGVQFGRAVGKAEHAADASASSSSSS